MRRCSLAQCLVAHYLMGRAGESGELGARKEHLSLKLAAIRLGSSLSASFSYFFCSSLSLCTSLLWPDIYLCRLVIVRHNGKILYCQHFFLPAPSSGFFSFVSSSDCFSFSRFVLVFSYPFRRHYNSDRIS